MRSSVRLISLSAVLTLAVGSFPGCSADQPQGGKMDGGAMDKGKMDGAMDKGKMDGGDMEKGKMDGAMDKGKMDGAPR